MVEILCIIIIVLLVIAIALLFFRKPKNNQDQINQFNVEQNAKIDYLNDNVQTLSTNSTNQLTNMTNQLNSVNQKLAEMKNISTDVENLSKVLANVKTRGVFGEAQLERLLEQTIPGMYETNVFPNPRSRDNVEFAIKIPNGKEGGITWLPIDSKFPMDRYAQLVQASEQQDTNAIESARKNLITEIDRQATKIKDKYIKVPYTTNFAIMYLPTEAIYLEAVKDPGGLQNKLQERGIMIAGPSTILALLNSLNMGFNMIKINENADDIRKMLGNIKRQFVDFNSNLSRIEKGINAADSALKDAQNRSIQISNKLENLDIEE